MIVILAWPTAETVVLRERRPDMGERPILGTETRGASVTWEIDGSEASAENASAYARRHGPAEGNHVLVFAAEGRDLDGAHAHAKRAVVRMARAGSLPEIGTIVRA